MGYHLHFTSTTSSFTFESIPYQGEKNVTNVRVNLAKGNKCDRCWKIVDDKVFDNQTALCDRCYNTIN